MILISTMGIYNNPIIPGFNPDPSIVRVGPDYFLVTSTFEYFPGVPVYHSTDLVNWTLIGHALTRRSQLDIRTPETGGGIWAPTIRWHDGVFYVTTACFDRYRPQADDRVWPRGFYVKTANIRDEQGWSEPVFFDQLGFDQDVRARSSNPTFRRGTSTRIAVRDERGVVPRCLIAKLCTAALLGRRRHRLPLDHLPQSRPLAGAARR